MILWAFLSVKCNVALNFENILHENILSNLLNYLTNLRQTYVL